MVKKRPTLLIPTEGYLFKVSLTTIMTNKKAMATQSEHVSLFLKSVIVCDCYVIMDLNISGVVCSSSLS